MICLGIDLGTQSLKVLIYDSLAHRTLAAQSQPLELISGDGGVREQKAQWWIHALRACMERIDQDLRSSVQVVSVSGQQHGFVPVDEKGGVLWNVKLWCDTSTAAECREIEEKCGGRDAVASRLGNPVLPGYTAGKIRWLYRHHPDVYGRLAHVLLPHDYLNWYLSGKYVMERGDASGTGLLNIFTGQWDDAAAGAVAPGLSSLLPPVSQSPGIIGNICPEASRDLGLPESCLVASGGGDNMMSAIGTGSVCDGDVTISLGTSGTLFTTSSRPACDAEGRFAAFCSSTGGWLPLLCTMNCTVASTAVMRLFGLDHAGMEDLLPSSSPGSGGLFMLPFLNGERVPDYPNGEGVLLGMRPWNLTEANMLRCTLEGVTYGFLMGLEAFCEKGIAVRRLTLTGGGAKSPFWRQLVSDVTGYPVRIPAQEEAAAFGAVLHGLWCATGGDISEVTGGHVVFSPEGRAVPDAASHDLYQKCYRKWLEHVAFFRPVFT